LFVFFKEKDKKKIENYKFFRFQHFLFSLSYILHFFFFAFLVEIHSGEKEIQLSKRERAFIVLLS